MVESLLEIHNHSALAEELMQPNSSKCDGSRTQMFDSHIIQTVVPDKGEYPRVFSRFENQVGLVSSSYRKASAGFIVLKKIVKNERNHLLIIKTGNVVDVVQMESAVNLTENYGFKLKQDTVFEEGKQYPAETVMYRCTGYDENLNNTYGVNLKTTYLSWSSKTFEDAIIICDEAADALAYNSVSSVMVTANTNDIFTNQYGDENDYRVCAGIGEKIKDKILINRRRVNYSAIHTLSNSSLRNIITGDAPFYVDGVIEDITIYANAPINPDVPHMKQLADLYEKQQAYYAEIVKCLSDYRDSGMRLSDAALFELSRASKFVSNQKWFMDGEFDNMVIIFKVSKRKPAVIGSKITNRYGGKGVISEIRKRKDMPGGADVVLNTLGVVNRLNPAALYELELNFIVDEFIRLYFNEIQDNLEKISAVIDLIGMINATQAADMEAFIQKELSAAKTDEEFNAIANNFVQSFAESKIPIHQPPFFDNINFHDFANVYEKYDRIKPIKVDGIEEELIIGDMYFIHLKHQPSGKFSARSVRQTNMRGTPSKSRDFKDHRQPYSTTPVRCGEQELANMMLCDTIDSTGDEVFNMLRQYSSDADERKSFAQALLTSEDTNILPQKQAEPEVLKAMLQSIMIGFERTDVINVPALDDEDL